MPVGDPVCVERLKCCGSSYVCFMVHCSFSRAKQHPATIKLGNVYFERVVKNNKRVMEILEQNWHLADPGDVEILSHFQVDYTRYLVEAEEQGRKNIPFSVVMKLGEISCMRQDVIACVRRTFERQRARLVKLTGVRGGVWTLQLPRIGQ